MNFRNLITDLISQYGQGTLAEKVGTDDSALSRFRSGQGSLPLSVIENLIKEAEAIILPAKDYKGLEDALAIGFSLWIKKRAQHNGRED